MMSFQNDPIKNQRVIFQKFISKVKNHKPFPAKMNASVTITSLLQFHFHFLFSHTLTSQIFPIFKFKCLVHLHTSKIIHPKSVITTPTSTHQLPWPINFPFKQQNFDEKSFSDYFFFFLTDKKKTLNKHKLKHKIKKTKKQQKKQK